MSGRLWRCACRILGIWLGCVVFLVPPMARAAPYADYVIDARTGEVLHQDNAETRLHPASLTKMMTLYIAFEAIKRGEITLDARVTVSRNAAAEPPSKLGLRRGQKIRLRYLIRAAAVRSANDAATAIGEAISGSEAAFAERMTRTGKALGMKKTTFKNANGLTRSGHMSTARDMTILARSLFYDYPQYYNLFSRRSTDAGIKTVRNTNRRFLDAYPGADGIKTGFTNAAGFNLVGSAQKGNKRIIAAVFGGKSTASRNARMAELLDIGFRKAPANAPVRKPAPPNYDGMLIARGGGVVSKSPRPRGRVSAPPSDLLIALEDGIETALGNLQQAAVGSAAAAPLETGDAPAVTPLARPANLIRGSQTNPVASVASGVQIALATVGDAREMKKEVSTAEIASAPAKAGTVAEAEADDPASAEAVAITPASAAISRDPGPARPGAAPPMRPKEIEMASLSSRNLPADGSLVAPSGQIRAPAVRPATPVVVSRMSSSGGRIWSINLGRYPTRFETEGVLLKTALAEPRSLTDGLRKVVARAGGFDAQFTGLTRDQADLACRRLQARNQTCFTVSP